MRVENVNIELVIELDNNTIFTDEIMMPLVEKKMVIEDYLNDNTIDIQVQIKGMREELEVRCSGRVKYANVEDDTLFIYVEAELYDY